MYLMTAAAIVVACLVALKIVVRRYEIKRFVLRSVDLYLKQRRLENRSPEEAFFAVINARYGRTGNARDLRHVMQLWNEKIADCRFDGEHDERQSLRELLKIMGLVERGEFSRLNERASLTTFERCYRELARRYEVDASANEVKVA